MSHYLHTIDLKLAAVLTSFGIAHRHQQPITCFGETLPGGKRHEQFTFWFEPATDDDRAKAILLMDAYWKFRHEGKFTLDVDHPLYYVIGVLENRETLLSWIRTKVEVIKRVPVGKFHILLSERARPELKAKLRAMAKEMGA